ncbi:MAG: agmatine deiminase family protein [Arenibacterium sp.]
MLADPTRFAVARRKLSSEIEFVECPLEDAWLREQVEAEFARTFGIQKTMCLTGRTDENGTDWHIDGIVCFVHPGVILFEDGFERSGAFLKPIAPTAARLRISSTRLGARPKF